jgi:hypothetical protein
MVRSTGSPRITVKRRGSKRHDADAAGWAGSRRDASDPVPDRDAPGTDPARAERVPVRAQ